MAKDNMRFIDEENEETAAAFDDGYASVDPESMVSGEILEGLGDLVGTVKDEPLTVAPQPAPAAPEKPKYAEILKTYQDALAKAQDRRRDVELMTGLTRGAKQISAGEAIRQGAKQAPVDDTFEQTMLKSATQDVSDVENLLKLYKDSDKYDRTMYSVTQSPYMTKDGQPVNFQRPTPENPMGRYVDMQGNTVDPSNIVRAVESKFLPGRGAAGLGSTKTGEAFTEKDMSQEQSTVLDKTINKTIDNSNKINDKLLSANNIIKMLKENNKLAVNAIKTQMPRLMGEVGNLSESEQAIWTGAQDWVSRINQYLSTITTSELTDSNKKELLDLVSMFVENANESYGAIIQNRSTQLTNVGIPVEFSVKKLPKLAGYEVYQKNKTKNTETKNDGTVLIQAPSGETKRVKKDAAQKYIEKGGVIVNE